MILVRCRCLAAILLATALHSPALAADAAPSTPGKLWRLALVEEASSDHTLAFQGLCLALQDAGLVLNGHVPLPESGASCAPMWQWMATNARGARLRFVADACYSAPAHGYGDIVRALREHIARGDIDLILALGTRVGQELAGANLPVPVIVSHLDRGVEAGTSAAAGSGGDIPTPTMPERTGEHVRIFHAMIPFASLGLAYADTPSGREAIALDAMEHAAAALGIDLVRCAQTPTGTNTALTVEDLRQCHARLAKQQVDAVYLTRHPGLHAASLPHVLEPLLEAGIPTFSQSGALEVQHGALLGMGPENALDEGRFSAGLLEAIVNGGNAPGVLRQHGSSTSLALNLRTAARIGWNPPLEVLATVDIFYQGKP